MTRVFLGIFFFAFAASAFAGPFGQNFHEVEAGQLYRSGQLDAKQLERKIDRYQIRTILNLRGEKSGEGWYDEESRVADKKGVTLVNIAMSAKRLPHRAELLKLIDTFDHAPRPILVHCLAGADRTGEAVSLYALDYEHESLADALKNLSVRFFHFDFIFPAQRYFLRDVYRGRQWALDSYDPCANDYQYYDRKKYCH